MYCERSSHDLFSVPLVQFGLLPLIPQSCRNLGKWLLRRTDIPDWISPEFWKRTQMQERIRQASIAPPFSTYAQQDLFRSTIHGLGIHGIELDERASSSFGLEKRHPFHDRRIIDLGQSGILDGGLELLLQRGEPGNVPAQPLLLTLQYRTLRRRANRKQ